MTRTTHGTASTRGGVIRFRNGETRRFVSIAGVTREDHRDPSELVFYVARSTAAIRPLDIMVPIERLARLKLPTGDKESEATELLSVDGVKEAFTEYCFFRMDIVWEKTMLIHRLDQDQLRGAEISFDPPGEGK